MDSTDAHALVARLLEGFNEGDMVAIERCLHPDVRAELPFAPAAMPAEVGGREAVMTMFREGRANFQRMILTPSQFYWSPDQSTMIMEATSDAELANGVPYRNRYVFVVRIEAERVILWREYFNGLIVAEAMAASAATA